MGLSCNVYSMTYCLVQKRKQIIPGETTEWFFRLYAKMFSYRRSSVQEVFDAKYSFSLQKEEISQLPSIHLNIFIRLCHAK